MEANANYSKSLEDFLCLRVNGELLENKRSIMSGTEEKTCREALRRKIEEFFEKLTSFVETHRRKVAERAERITVVEILPASETMEVKSVCFQIAAMLWAAAMLSWEDGEGWELIPQAARTELVELLRSGVQGFREEIHARVTEIMGE